MLFRTLLFASRDGLLLSQALPLRMDPMRMNSHFLCGSFSVPWRLQWQGCSLMTCWGIHDIHYRQTTYTLTTMVKVVKTTGKRHGKIHIK